MSGTIKLIEAKGKMFGLFKKSTDDGDLRLETPVPAFIPYACHYNANTILTKNGELLQTIKIVGFTYETLGGSNIGLRELVRKVVSEQIKSTHFSLYFHTVRRKQSLDTHPKYSNYFSQKLHDEWVKKNSWDDKYVNELYLTVIHGAAPFVSTQPINLMTYFIPGKLYQAHDEYLEQAFIDLDATVNALLENLAHCGAVRLGLNLDPKLGYVSDLLKFFGKIIHLEETDMPMPMADLSRSLAKYKVAFGNNALEVKRDSSKFFASILSLKSYHEVSALVLDKFLQLPQEMVITQTINFADKIETLKNYHYQNYILKVSGDEEFQEILGLNDFFDDKKTSPIDFCESQITVMLIADTIPLLEERVVSAAKTMFDIGMPVVREDLNLEHCFWSQLPANFRYISRKSPLATCNIAGLASLHNFPVGSLSSKWGEAITLLKTMLGTPYFFNFHVGDNGHTIIVGSPSAGKVTLLNFLLSESLKLNPNIFYLDVSQDSEIFIKAVGGKYLVFKDKPTPGAVKFNPLLLEDNQENRSFLCEWFLFLLDKYVDHDQLKDFTDAAKAAVNIVFSMPKEKRKLSNAEEFFNLPEFDHINHKIIVRLSKWYGPGKYAHIFDNDTDDLDYRNNVLAIDVAEVYDTEISFNLPILSYLMHFFKIHYKGTPSIMAVSGGNRVFNNLYFEKNLRSILDELTSYNSIIVAACSFSSETSAWSEEIGNIYNEKMATKIFLPDDSSYDIIKRIFKLTEQEALYLEALDHAKRQFIIRQLEVSIVSEMNLKGLDTSLMLLSCENESDKQKLRTVINNFGDANSIWLKKLYGEA